jgi:hypothetical protein
VLVSLPLAALLLGWAALAGLHRGGHRAFAAGRWSAARRRYRVIAAVAPGRRRRQAARLSLAACQLAAGDHAGGFAALTRLAGLATEPTTRAVWLGNRAYAALRCPALGIEPRVALAWVEEALAARPGVPALLHTRAIGLAAVGRADESLAVLDGLSAVDDRWPALGAERCHDLAAAWDARGHAAYAADYRARAARLAGG